MWNEKRHNVKQRCIGLQNEVKIGNKQFAKLTELTSKIPFDLDLLFII
eukprot:UN23985